MKVMTTVMGVSVNLSIQPSKKANFLVETGKCVLDQCFNGSLGFVV